MKTTIYQHIYTSRPKRGYGTLVCHSKIKAFDAELANQGAYKRPSGSARMSKSIQYPVQYKFYWVGEGRNRYRVFARSQYLGDDFHSAPPRPGNYISQSWMIKATDAKGLPPYAVFKEMDAYIEKGNIADREAFHSYMMQVLRDQQILEIDFGTKATPQTPGAKGKIQFEVAFGAFKEDVERQKIFLFLIDQLINNTPKGFGKRPLIADNGAGLEDWFFAFLAAFPSKLMDELILSSYVNHPDNSQSLITGVIRSESLRTEFGASNSTFKWLEASARTADREPANVYSQILQSAIRDLDHEKYLALIDDIVEDKKATQINKYINEPLRFRQTINNVDQLCNSSPQFIERILGQFKDIGRKRSLQKALKSKCPETFFHYLIAKLIDSSKRRRDNYDFFIENLSVFFLDEWTEDKDFTHQYIKAYIDQFLELRRKKLVRSESEIYIVAFKVLNILKQQTALISYHETWVDVFLNLVGISVKQFDDIKYITMDPRQRDIDYNTFANIVEALRQENGQFKQMIPASVKNKMQTISKVLVFQEYDQPLNQVKYLINFLGPSSSKEGEILGIELQIFASALKNLKFRKINWKDENLKTAEAKKVLFKLKSLFSAIRGTDDKEHLSSLEKTIGYDTNVVNGILGITEIKDYKAILFHYNLWIRDRKNEIGKKNIEKEYFRHFQQGMTIPEWETLKKVLLHATESLGTKSVHTFLVKFVLQTEIGKKEVGSATLEDKRFPDSLPRAVRMLKMFYTSSELRDKEGSLKSYQEAFIHEYFKQIKDNEVLMKLTRFSKICEVSYKLITQIGDRLDPGVLSSLSGYIKMLLRKEDPPYRAQEMIMIRRNSLRVLEPLGISLPAVPKLEFIDQFNRFPFTENRADHFTTFQEALDHFRQKKMEDHSFILEALANIFLKPFTVYHWDLLLWIFRENRWKEKEIAGIIIRLFEKKQSKQREHQMNYEILKRDFITLLCIRKNNEEILEYIISEHRPSLKKHWISAIDKSKAEVENYSDDLSRWEKLNDQFTSFDKLKGKFT